MNNSNLSSSAILLILDIVNMFSSIDNNIGIVSVRKYLDERECKTLPTDCVIETLELCLSCNNSVFNNTNYLQTDGTAQGPHMSCSYADIAMAYHDRKALSYFLSPTTWKRFRDDIFVAWEHGTDTLPPFLDYLNNVDEAGKIKFTMEIADQEKGLEFLDLRIKCVDGKLSADIFGKPTNSFTYVKPFTCYPRKSITNIPRGIALRLRRICDTDEKFESRANENKQYLIARDYKPSLVDKQFQEVSKITRTEATAKRPKNNQVSKIKFLTTYNPGLPKIDGIIRKHLPLLHSDDSLKKLFPANIFSTIFKRNKNLKEILAPSKYPNPKNSRQNSITSCNKCDICKNYMVFDRTFRCTVTGKVYYIKGEMNCESSNIIYLITCMKCLEQYVGSAIKFKSRFRIHKSDIKTKKDRCGTARHFNNKCCDSSNPFVYLRVQLIEKVYCIYDDCNIEDILWDREKYWQSQLFTNVKGMNIISDLSCSYIKRFV